MNYKLIVAGFLTSIFAFGVGIEIFSRLDDYVFINATSNEGGFDFQTDDRYNKRDLVKVIKGDDIYIYTEAEDEDGIVKTILSINELGYEFHPKNNPCNIAGVVNGLSINTSPDFFEIGKNILRYEVVDRKNKSRSDSIEVIVEEK
jgi:hypothetical protein